MSKLRTVKTSDTLQHFFCKVKKVAGASVDYYTISYVSFTVEIRSQQKKSIQRKNTICRYSQTNAVPAAPSCCSHESARALLLAHASRSPFTDPAKVFLHGTSSVVAVPRPFLPATMEKSVAAHLAGEKRSRASLLDDKNWSERRKNQASSATTLRRATVG